MKDYFEYNNSDDDVNVHSTRFH